MENNSTIYTEEELGILKLTKEKRLKMVDDMTKDGTPSYKEVEVINQMLTSLEKSVHDTVSNRLKHQDNNNKAEIISSVAEAIRQIKSNTQSALPLDDASTIIADEFIPTDIVLGEADMEKRQFTLDEIMVEDKED